VFQDVKMNSSDMCTWANRLGILVVSGAVTLIPIDVHAQTTGTAAPTPAPNPSDSAAPKTSPPSTTGSSAGSDAAGATGAAPVSAKDGAVNAAASSGEAGAAAADGAKAGEKPAAETTDGKAKEEPKEEPKEEAKEKEEEKPLITMSGAVEISYAYNLNNPSNGMTAWRWYDFRHNVVGLQNALLTTNFEKGPVSGMVQLQLGNFAEVFWDAGRGPEKDLLWRLLQQATAKWTTPYEKLSIEGGAFNVPFGPEWNAAYLNWTWSAGNLFALMPYQIGGVRANFDAGNGWTIRGGVYNGWDQIVTDNNTAKSIMFSFEWTSPADEETYFYVNYMVGNERDKDDARGPYARHTFDVYAQLHATERLFLRGHTFSGFEPTRGDTVDGWFGAGATIKVDATDWLSLVGRGDVVYTKSGESGDNIYHSDTLALTGRNSNDSTLIGSVTGTVDIHTASNVALRLEARHDRADFPLFFKDTVQQDVVTGEDISNATNQTTLTAGLTTWF